MATEHIGRYALVTPARNEASLLGHTLDAIVKQTHKPLRWVIVDDGSTDRTAALVEEYSRQHAFIRLVRVQNDSGRNFGRKALAFMRGVQELSDVPYEFIGNLDADISFEPDYYARVLGKFEADPVLGVAGGIVYTKIGDGFATTDETLDSVGGAVQLFRRTCFEVIGGYQPLRWGGIDAAAEITARMHGWTVRKFPELRVLEHRRTGSAEAGPVQARVREGRRFYSLGYSPAFYLLRCLYRVKDRPFVIGSVAALCGFAASHVKRQPILLSPDVVQYLRTEQRARIRKLAQAFFS